MKIVLLTNYPLADNKKWKQDLVEALAGQHEVHVIFGRKSLWAHLQTYLRQKHETDIVRRYRQKTERTISFLKKKRIPYYLVSDIKHLQTLAVLRWIKPDYGIAAVDQMIRKEVIDCFACLLNVHYGNLPQVKGWNATEWSILVESRLEVCLHRIVPRMDQGEVFLRKNIEVGREEDLEALRLKCQEAAKKLYLEFFEDPQGYMSRGESNEAGENYYLMNWQLKEFVKRKMQVIGK